MIIAIPVTGEDLCAHFGHCEHFALVEVDDQSRQVKGVTLVQPPPHQPGLLPRWLHERGVTTVIAGGIGLRAQQLLAELGIEVIAGVPATNPQQLVEEYLTGQLASGNNPCHH